MHFLSVLLCFSTLSCLVVCQTCLQETNKARANSRLAAYQYDDKLGRAAKAHNDRMISQNCFSHQCPGEPSLGDRVKQAGYKFGGIAENLVKGVGSCQDAINSWLKSEGHRNNLLNTKYRHVGCASGSKYYTCVYGSP